MLRLCVNGRLGSVISMSLVSRIAEYFFYQTFIKSLSSESGMIRNSDITIYDRLRAAIDEAEAKSKRRTEGRRAELVEIPKKDKPPAVIRHFVSQRSLEVPKEQLMYDALLSSARWHKEQGDLERAAYVALEAGAWDVAYNLSHGSAVENGRVVPGEALGLDPRVFAKVYPPLRGVHGPQFDPVEVLATLRSRGDAFSFNGLICDDQERLSTILDSAVHVSGLRSTIFGEDVKAMRAARNAVDYRMELGPEIHASFVPVYKAVARALDVQIPMFSQDEEERAYHLRPRA